MVQSRKPQTKFCLSIKQEEAEQMTNYRQNQVPKLVTITRNYIRRGRIVTPYLEAHTCYENHYNNMLVVCPPVADIKETHCSTDDADQSAGIQQRGTALQACLYVAGSQRYATGMTGVCICMDNNHC